MQCKLVLDQLDGRVLISGMIHGHLYGVEDTASETFETSRGRLVLTLNSAFVP